MDLQNSAEEIIHLKVELDCLQSDDAASVEEITDAQEKLRLALVEEEVFWQQKSRVMWLMAGDQNIQYFHASTKQRRTQNQIIGILNSNGLWMEKEVEIEQITIEYFQDIFSSTGISDLETSLRNIPQSVTQEMNDNITLLVSPAEVEAAVFAIHPEKAPGPDGMTTLFY